MKKSELEKELAIKFNLQAHQPERIIDTITEHIAKVLKDGGRIEIRGFGSFFTIDYRTYEGRNPRTGETVVVPPKRLPRFRLSNKLLKKLN